MGIPRVQATSSGGFGAAIAFQRTPLGWVTLSELVPSNGSLNDVFGNTVAAQGSSGVVGAENAIVSGDHTGSVYTFDMRCRCERRRIVGARRFHCFDRIVQCTERQLRQWQVWGEDHAGRVPSDACHRSARGSISFHFQKDKAGCCRNRPSANSGGWI